MGAENRSGPERNRFISDQPEGSRLEVDESEETSSSLMIVIRSGILTTNKENYKYKYKQKRTEIDEDYEQKLEASNEVLFRLTHAMTLRATSYQVSARGT